jgi:hypothetical protein
MSIGTFAYRRMTIGLDNALTTFRICMNAIFVDCIEKLVDVFCVYGTSFDNYLFNPNKILQRCKDQYLVFNWDKFHFMVTLGVFLGHRISGRGVEVDIGKVQEIEKLPPRDIRGTRSFLWSCMFLSEVY